MTTNDCAGLVALVTGGNKGVGAGISAELAAHGATVVSLSRSPEQADLFSVIRAAGGTAEHRQVDVSDEQQVNDVIDGVHATYGRIDVVVNSAMALDAVRDGNELPFGEQTSADFDYMVKVGVYAPFWIARRTLPGMVERGNGAFINISSVTSRIAIPNLPTYSLTKAALEAMARGIAVDYGSYGIRANSILVGPIETPQNSDRMRMPAVAEALRTIRLVERMGVPEDVGRMAAFLASPANDYLTGGIYPVDGGQDVTQHVPLGAMRDDADDA